MATLDGNDLGQIENEQVGKTSDIDQQTYPFSDSTEAFCFDFSGAKRIITISGVKTATSAATLWNWVQTMDALQNGDQNGTGGYKYVSGGWANATVGLYTDGEFNVYIGEFRVTHANLAKLMVRYQLVLLEGI